MVYALEGMQKYSSKFISILFIFICSHAYGNNDNKKLLNAYFNEITNLEFQKAKKSIEDLQDIELKEGLTKLSDLLFYKGQKKSFEFDTIVNFNQNSLHKYVYQLRKAYYHLFYRKRPEDVFTYFIDAYITAKELNDSNLLKFSILSILEFYQNEYVQLNDDFKPYLNEYSGLASSSNEKFRENILKAYFRMENLDPTKRDAQEFIDLLQKLSLKIGKKSKLHILYYSLKAIHYETISKEKKKKGFHNQALEYYNKAISFHNKALKLSKQYPFLKYIKFRTYYWLAKMNYESNQIEESFRNLDSAKLYIDVSYPINSYLHINSISSKNNAKLNKYKLGYEQLKFVMNAEYKIRFRENIIGNSIKNVVVKAKEKEEDNVRLKKKENEQQIIIFVISTFILLISTISYLQLKNSRKKRILALQEKELETQKNLTLLKEQEITSINAMVEGQEKERKRVAEDLHDNLGSVLATLKLHFENLKINREKKKIDQETLFDKTEGLIDEAYLKVRSIAHAKNAGVIANQGLLVAIQMMAEKISSANAVQIEVVHFGLEKRLDNSLEISLFRIIQELVANIIKHADAKQATINVSQYEGNLNIILEDNGKGMNVSQVDSQKGMGIHSIKTRIEHLQGSFTIDSTPTKGTTVIMNIPIT